MDKIVDIVDFQNVEKKTDMVQDRKNRFIPESDNCGWDNSETDALADLMDYCEEILDVVAETAKSEIQKAGLAGIGFALQEPESEYMSQLLGYDEEPDNLLFSYVGTGTDGTEYILYIVLDLDNDAMSYTGLFRILDGRIETFSLNHAGDGWQYREGEQKIYDVLIQDGAQADFVRSYAEYIGMYPMMLDPEKTLKLLQQNKRLTGLYEMLHGLADFDFEETGKKIRAYLVPDDPYRCGGAVYYDKGTFHICQWLIQEDDAEACILDNRNIVSEDDDGIDYMYTPRSLFHEVYTEKDAGKVRNSLNFFWDHYSRDAMCFNFPLSAHAYAEGSRPYSKLHTYTQYGKRDLTVPEEQQLKKLKQFFRIR